MKDLPDPLPGGSCVECRKVPAITNDGRFCAKCMRRLIREDNPVLRDLSRKCTDEIGRKSRSTAVIGGCPKTPDEQ